MVGDTTHDLQLAANAGCASVAVSFGAHSHEEFASFTSPCTSPIRPPTSPPGWRVMPESRPLLPSVPLAPPQRSVRRRRARREGQGDPLRRPALPRAGARLRAALRRPRRRLPEPLRPRADRARLATGRVPRRRPEFIICSIHGAAYERADRPLHRRPVRPRAADPRSPSRARRRRLVAADARHAAGVPPTDRRVHRRVGGDRSPGSGAMLVRIACGVVRPRWPRPVATRWHRPC